VTDVPWRVFVNSAAKCHAFPDEQTAPVSSARYKDALRGGMFSPRMDVAPRTTAKIVARAATVTAQAWTEQTWTGVWLWAIVAASDETKQRHEAIKRATRERAYFPARISDILINSLFLSC